MTSHATGRTGRWDDALGRAALRSAQILLVLAVVACVVLAVRQLKVLVAPLLISLILAAALSPVVRFLRRRGWRPALATWTALLTGMGLLGLVLWLVVRAIRDEAEELVEGAQAGLDQLQQYLTEGPLGLTDEQVSSARQSASDFLTSDTVQGGAVAGATAAAEVVAGMLLGAVLLFYFLKDGHRIFTFLVQPLEPRVRDRSWRIANRSVEVLGGYVRGTAVIALVDAVLIGLALVILGVPLALPLATIVFLGAFIPLVGATLAGALAALVALVSNGPVTALIVLVVVIAVNQLEGDLLAPVVLGKALDLHPLAILLALTAGTIVAGILGALLSVPIAAVLWTAIKEWHASDDLTEPETTPVTPGTAPDTLTSSG